MSSSGVTVGDGSVSDRRRVPIDERVAGFDRRTIWPGLFALAVYVVWAHVMPWVDEQVGYDDPIVAGDVIDLGRGDLTFVPAVGWDLVGGVRVDDSNVTPVGDQTSATVAYDLAFLRASTASWDGTAEELLDQVIEVSDDLDRVVAEQEQQRIDIVTTDGRPGRLAYFVGEDQQGVIATFVVDLEPAEEGATPVSLGVSFESFGADESIEQLGTEIGEMIASLSYEPSSGEEAAG